LAICRYIHTVCEEIIGVRHCKRRNANSFLHKIAVTYKVMLPKINLKFGVGGGGGLLQVFGFVHSPVLGYVK